ncbi:IS200/IS605 family transposase [Micromonospora sagamiensis]|uniref:Putative transposase n=1 Tax=Micromonospora sagamiensis TaxID=47875 RepID=A0A562WCP9_9ACTN|nr:IS200/IS605 family transposase [Micromonospora sagamiensis]TWJ28040.1 putative transposase [Micromonospora sagamiensis]BCL13069.1 IS200/IS605 family transposase [Micromonospora sagamiensis]
MDEVRSNNNVVYRCHYHVVWCPKYRRKVIDGEVDDRLKEIIREVCAERNAPIEAIETMADQVHLRVVVDPQYGIHRLVKQIKGRSSRLLRQEFPHLKSRMPTLWTNSYFVATTGGATQEAVNRYVENQRNV